MNGALHTFQGAALTEPCPCCCGKGTYPMGRECDGCKGRGTALTDDGIALLAFVYEFLLGVRV